MIELFANSGGPDQMPQNVVSDLGLHCLPDTLLGVYRLQWVNTICYLITANKCIVKQFVVFKLQLLYFYLLLYKYCWYSHSAFFRSNTVY